MRKVLLIQSRLQPERAQRECAEFKSALGEDAELSCISVLDEVQAWSNPEALLRGYDAVFIGGSGDFHLHGGEESEDEARKSAQKIMEKLRATIEYLFEKNIPTLGICFGHQLIAEMRGGMVTSDVEQKKTGTYEVRLTQEGRQDPVFSSIPESFQAQFAHKDSVTVLPQGATLLASGSACRFSALRYGTTIYTVQFHPESTRESMLRGAEQMPHYIPKGKAPEQLFSDSPHTSGLISKFVKIIS